MSRHWSSLSSRNWRTRLRSLAGCVAAFALCGSLHGVAQPLERGREWGDSKLFLESGQMRLVDGSDKLTTVKKARDIEAILKPDGSDWAQSAVALGDGSARYFNQKLQPQTLKIPGEKPVEGLVWGDFVVLYRADSDTLVFQSANDQSKEVAIPGRTGAPIPLGPDRLLVMGPKQDYFLISGTDLAPKKFSHPFPPDKVKVTVSGDSALLWSLQSPLVLIAGSELPTTLSELPTIGVKATASGDWAIAGPAKLCYLTGAGHTLFFPRPQALSADNLKSSVIFLANDSLQTVTPDPELGTVCLSVNSAGRPSGKIYKGSTFKHLVLPSATGSGAAFLFSETSIEEPKVEDNGKPVLDPKTGEPAKHTVKGCTVSMLDGSNTWRPLFSEPRARLTGPCQRVGSLVIYATQTLPPNQVGIERETNSLYPYPEVVLHALSVDTGLEVWRTDLPRGQSPSAARMPEKDWPLTSDNKLLLTTEDSRLEAFNPASGKLLWTSSILPLDESRPKMLEWNGVVGLVATDNTTKKLLLISLADGTVLAKLNLNSIFNAQRTLHLVGVTVICLALLLYIYLAGKRKLFIRRIAGLEALEEAVGRATEMGKPVLYVTGLADIDDIQTLASLSILSHVAKKTADYDSSIIATTSRAVTFSAAQEVVRDAFTVAGRPDSFSVESVQYISDDQFGYAAGVDGIMLRDKPAANFYMGNFFAESLIFAETGYATGAIQIAGTAQVSQLPFFVAACDYTLIGEELFAASAYLSGDPLQVGSLRGQDVGKAIVMIFLVLASLDATFGGPVSHYLGGLL